MTFTLLCPWPSFAMVEVLRVMQEARVKIVPCESLLRADLDAFAERSTSAVAKLTGWLESFREGTDAQVEPVRDTTADSLYFGNWSGVFPQQTNIIYSKLRALLQDMRASDFGGRSWLMMGDKVPQALQEWVRLQEPLAREVQALVNQRNPILRWLNSRISILMGQNHFWDTSSVPFQQHLAAMAENPTAHSGKLLLSTSHFIVPKTYYDFLIGYGRDPQAAREETLALWEKLMLPSASQATREGWIDHVVFIEEQEGQPPQLVWLVFFRVKAVAANDSISSNRRDERFDWGWDPALVPIPVRKR